MTKISQLSSIGDSLAIGDQFLIRDIDDTGSPNKSVTVSGITRALDVGTALAPAIAFASDKNTGIYSPAADTLAFVEGGTEAMRIDSSGNVGIGTSSPLVPLDIRTPQATLNLSAGSDPLVNLNILNPDTTIGTGPTLAFSSYYSGASTGPLATISVPRTVGTGTGADALSNSIVISQAQIGSPNLVERLRINSSGNVGIGTSSPGAKLHVETIPAAVNQSGSVFFGPDTDYGFEIRNVIDGTGFPRVELRAPVTGAGPMLFFAGGATERLRIGSSGNVGIGTSSPGYLLHVNTSAAADVELAVQNSAGLARYGTRTSGNAFAGSFTAGKSFELWSANAQAVTIDSSGNVGIGTTTSLARLTLEKAFAGGTAIDTNTTTASTTYNGAVFRHNGTSVGQIAVSTTATSYITSSDYRLKENVTAVTDGITRLQQLNPSRFNFIADPDHTVDGFIAHEAQAVVPECVTGEKDAVDDDGNPKHQGIDQSKLVPLLTAALQEAIAKIETLETRLSALEGA